jgi:hypothetical protein
MPTYPSRVPCILLFAISAAVQLLAGCGQPKSPGTVPGVGYPCGDQVIWLNHSSVHGVDRKAVVACPNHYIEWKMPQDMAEFEIVFDDAPVGTTKNYGTGPGETTKTGAYSAPTEVNVYKYTVTKIVDKNGSHFGPFKDPHVVGGGGIPVLLSAQ